MSDRGFEGVPVKSRKVAIVAAGLILSASVGVVSAAPPGVLAARPSTIDFHTRSVGTENYKRTKITNTSGADVLLLVSGGLPDDFGFGLMPGSTCPVLDPGALAPGDSCYAVVRFSPTEFFAGWVQRGTLIATAWDPVTGTRLVDLEIPVIGVGSL
jgi:hypothetical protein